ncbi:Respirasome Complex Assembly Factor 1 [Geodia barretti]|uniref:Respirasome Complex Assembly Factor 1 n=1 Tax=Geodia barretti TaxID=519541 RepID=A0AA35RGI9_GEOBA|nr:Respirasome Complex Assembly Factor 1 [Geodia barretti]
MPPVGKESAARERASWIKALRPRQKWNNKDEFLDALYWLRQGLCLLLGLVWGIIPLQGYVGMTLFLAVNGGAVYSYCALYQRVEEEEYGGIWELLKEGFMTSFALFLVSSLNFLYT